MESGQPTGKASQDTESVWSKRMERQMNRKCLHLYAWPFLWGEISSKLTKRNVQTSWRYTNRCCIKKTLSKLFGAQLWGDIQRCLVSHLVITPGTLWSDKDLSPVGPIQGKHLPSEVCVNLCLTCTMKVAWGPTTEKGYWISESLIGVSLLN